MRSPELARGRSPPRWPSEFIAFAGDDSPVQLQLRRAIPQLQVPLVVSPRNHIYLGASPPDPLHTLSLGASSPRFRLR